MLLSFEGQTTSLFKDNLLRDASGSNVSYLRRICNGRSSSNTCKDVLFHKRMISVKSALLQGFLHKGNVLVSLTMLKKKHMLYSVNL